MVEIDRRSRPGAGTIGAVALVIGGYVFVAAGSVPIVAITLLIWQVWSYAE